MGEDKLKNCADFHLGEKRGFIGVLVQQHHLSILGGIVEQIETNNEKKIITFTFVANVYHAKLQSLQRDGRLSRSN